MPPFAVKYWTDICVDHMFAVMELKGQLQVTSWDEKELRTFDDHEGSKVTQASIGYRVTGDLDGDSVEDVLMYYRPDGTAAVLGLWRVSGSASGRTGSVVLSSTGGYDGTTATGELRVVPGSGTGDFATVRGTGTTSATKEQVDYVLELEL